MRRPHRDPLVERVHQVCPLLRYVCLLASAIRALRPQTSQGLTWSLRWRPSPNVPSLRMRRRAHALPEAAQEVDAVVALRSPASGLGSPNLLDPGPQIV